MSWDIRSKGSRLCASFRVLISALLYSLLTRFFASRFTRDFGPKSSRSTHTRFSGSIASTVPTNSNPPPDLPADDLWARFEVPEWRTFCPTERLRDRPARLKLLLFDSASDTVEFAPHITLTNADFRFISSEQLQEVGLDPGPILVEPKAKNTAAAILTANISERSTYEEAVLLVAPSDQLIPDKADFHRPISARLPQVRNYVSDFIGDLPCGPVP
jgi:hypothetical protein